MTPQDRERARVVAAAAAAGVPLDHLLVFAPVFDAGTCGRNHTICFAVVWKHPKRALSQHTPRHSPMQSCCWMPMCARPSPCSAPPPPHFAVDVATSESFMPEVPSRHHVSLSTCRHVRA